MNKRRLRLVIGISALLIILIGGGIVHMVYQHQVKEAQEHQKMVAIATSEEARKVYEEKIRKRDSKAFTDAGIIQSYKVDETSLEYNPMGGLKVKVFVNDDNEEYINFNLIDNENGSYHTAYYGISPRLSKKLKGLR